MTSIPPQGNHPAKNAAALQAISPDALDHMRGLVEQNAKMISEMMARSAKTEETLAELAKLEADRIKLKATHQENDRQREHEADEASARRQHEDKQRAHEERQREYDEQKQIRDHEERQRERDEAALVRRDKQVARLTWLIGIPIVIGVLGIAGGLIAIGHPKEAGEFAFLVITSAAAYLSGKKNALSGEDARKLKEILGTLSARPSLPAPEEARRESEEA